MKEYSIEELKSSRMIYDRNPPRLLMSIIVAIALMLVLICAWAAANERTEVVKASGLVASSDSGYVSSQVSGVVIEVSCGEGDEVSEGDAVISIDSGDVKSQASAYKVLADMYGDAAEKYGRAVSKLEGYQSSSPGHGDNPFDRAAEFPYHAIYQSFLDEVGAVGSREPLESKVRALISQNASSFRSAGSQYESQYVQYDAQAAYCEGVIGECDRAVAALRAYDASAGGALGNPFDGSSEYARFAEFEGISERLQSTPTAGDRQSIADAGISSYLLTRSQQEPSQRTYRAQADYFRGMADAYGRAASITAFDPSLPVSSSGGNSNPFGTEDYLYAAYQSVLDSITSLRAQHHAQSASESVSSVVSRYASQFSQLRDQNEALRVQNREQYELYSSGAEQAVLRAPRSGLVHFAADLRVGVAVTAGQTLFSVSPELSEGSCEIVVYVPSAFRPYIEVGMDADIVFAGVDRNEQGTIPGKVASIGADSVVDQNGNAAYRCVVSPDSIVLPGGQDIIRGMAAEVSIQYETVTWLDWMKDKLGLRR